MQWLKQKLKKLTLFDYIIAGVFIFGVIFFALIFFRKSTFITVTMKVGEEDIVFPRSGVRDWFGQLFYPGMKERDGVGLVQAEVTEVVAFDTLPSKKAVYLTVKLKAVYTKAANKYSFRGKPVLIGQPIKLQLDGVNAEGLITGIEGVEDPRQKETIIVEAEMENESPIFLETSGVKGYIADAIKVGDKVYDNKGNAVITVVGKRVENAKKAVATSDGQVVIRPNPLLKDIYLTLEVNAIKIGARYHLFDDQPILIGEEIPFNLPFLSILPVVTKVAAQK